MNWGIEMSARDIYEITTNRKLHNTIAELLAENERLQEVVSAALLWRNNEVGIVTDCTCERCDLMRACDEYGKEI